MNSKNIIVAMTFLIILVSLISLEKIELINLLPEKLPSITQQSHLGELIISGTTELCGSYDNVWDKIVVTETGILNICAFNGTADTGFVNISLGAAGNFTVYPGGLINGSSRGGRGGAATVNIVTGANATKGDNGNNWTTGGTGPLPNGGGGGGGARTVNTGSTGGGGGAFGGAGGVGGEQPTTDFRGEAGLIYGMTTNLTLRSGSGGGGAASDGGGLGGSGGAGFKIDAGLGVIKIEGIINVSGFDGVDGSSQDQGGGGGGSGGHVILYGADIDVSSAIINASAGRGGNAPGAGADDCGGGGGGGGRIYLVYSTLTNTSVSTVVIGGSAGTSTCTGAPTAGTAGTIRHNDTDATFTDNAPQWVIGSPSVNNSNPATGDFVRHNVNWTDDGELHFATLEVNGTGITCGTTANVTSDVIVGTSNWSNLTWQIPTACLGKAIGWRIYVKDFPNNQTNVTALQSYQVEATPLDITNPAILDNPSSEANLSILTRNWILVNVSATDANLDSVRLSWQGVNETFDNNAGSHYWENKTSLSDGNYSFYSWANDTAGNRNFTGNRTITIDTIAPTVTLPFYVNGTLKKNTETLTLNISVSDATTAGSACKIEINGTNTTVAFSSGWCNTTSIPLTNLADGNRTINVYANDTAGHWNLNNSFVVKIDSTAPIITLPFYVNGTKKTSTSDTLTLNISVSDAGTSGSACKIDINGTNQTVAVSSGWCNITNGFLTNLADGNKTINVYANDTVNTFGLNNSFVVFVDATAPVAQFGTNPTDNMNRSNSSVTFDLRGFDGISLSNIALYGNWTGSWIANQTNTSPINATYWNITVEAIPEGTWRWAVWANDTLNNQAFSTANRTFTIDSINPSIQFISRTESNSSNLTRNNIQVNVSATDTNLNTITIRLYNSTNFLLRTNYSATSPFYINYTNLGEGTYYFNATTNDTLNNQNSTETRTISLILPTLSITRPKNETYLINQSLLLNFTSSNAEIIKYNIDNGTNTTITGNTTFNTTSGNHTLYLFATNGVGTTIKNVSFTANITRFLIDYNNYANNGSSIEFNASSFEDIQNLSGVILERTAFGKIEFTQAINLTNDSVYTDNLLNLDSNTNMSSNFIDINTTALPNLNKSATLSLYGLTFTDPRILRNDELCSSDICTEVSYSGGIFIFNVTSFTNYSAEETPIAATTEAAGGGGIGKAIECNVDSDCSVDEKCLDNTCVKLFDVKILEFESPATLGDFFDFIYLAKGMAEINGDVQIDFWIENAKGEKVTSGSDVIYFGNFEEKKEAAKIFLPEDVSSGTYRFFVKVTFEDYSASSYRTIAIEVKNGIAEISESGESPPILLIIIVVIVVLLAALSKGHLDRRKIKKAEEIYHNRLFNPQTKHKGKSVSLHHLAKIENKEMGIDKNAEQKAKSKEELDLALDKMENKKPSPSLGKAANPNTIDTKEELDNALDNLEKKDKNRKEKPF